MADARPTPSPAAVSATVLRAFLASPAIIVVTRVTDGVVLDANPAFLAAAALPRESVVGRTVTDLGFWHEPARREEFRAELQRAGRVQGFEARFCNHDGGLRDVMINAEVVAIEGEPCSVVVALDITERRRREREQDAVFRISEAANSSDDLSALFRKLHEIIGGLMPARNLFFALVSPDGRELSFPYYEDECSTRPNPRPRGKGLTDYVVDSRQPLLARQEELLRLLGAQGYKPTGTPSAVWLGAPLNVGPRTIGVVAVQDYRDERVYDDESKRLLNFVAEQAAAAVERRRVDDALRASAARERESQEYFTKSFHASPALMLLTDLGSGRIIETNHAFLAAAGFARDEVVGRTTLELNLWYHAEERERVVARIRAEGKVHGYETTFRNKGGAPRYVFLNADVFELGGRPVLLITALDFTERRRREREQAALYRISAAALDATDRVVLFQRVHAIIGEILSAETFFIAAYDAARDEVSFPLWSNARYPAVPAPRPLGRNLTDYVLRQGEPLHLVGDQLPAFTARTGHTAMFGSLACWLAVPLLAAGRPAGVIALIDYDNAAAYRPEDAQFLTFVASQITVALERVEAERERRAAQEYFSHVFHASPAAMTIRELATNRLLEVNDAYVAASGYTRAEILGEAGPPQQLWTDTAQQQAFLTELRAQGRVRGFEADFRTKSGQSVTYHLSADLIDVRGRRCLLTAGLDITDQHRRDRMQRATYRISRAVLAGHELPELFREIHETLGGLLPAKNFYVALVSPDGRELSFPYFVDERLQRPGTTPPARQRGLGFTEYILDLGRPLLVTTDELTARLRELGPYRPPPHPPAIRLGAPLKIGQRTLGVIAVHDYRPDASYQASDLELLQFVADQAAAAVQRRIAEQAIERAERQYRGIFENALEGLYQSTADGRFLRVNPAFARMLGYPSPAALIVAVNDIGAQFYVQADRRGEFMHRIQHANEVTDFESEIIRRDGARVWISESVRIHRNAAGQPELFEGVAIDITARREADRALRAAKEAADEASRAKTQFLASMSHELRTPLNGILGYTQILRRDASLTEKQRAGVGVIHQSAEHLLALINDVLDLAKVEARKLELHPSEFDLPEFARQVAEVFAPRAREKNLRLETAFAPDLPRTIVCDAQRLRQVLFNLLSNAVKFTTQGGVVFSLERTPAGAVRFSVSDSGPGISPEDQKRLFEPFAQLGDAKQRHGGTGLGLNVSRSLLERFGSQLQVESRVGWGTRFWFDLALPEGTGTAEPAGSRQPWRIVGYEGPRRRVLVADDHEPNRALLVDLLTPLGFDLATAEDGEAAVQLARRFRPHLALLDVRMPRLDGLGAARRIRAELGADAPCVIGISASAHDEAQAAALAAGCAAFIAKPFAEETLFELIGRHLGVRWRHSDQPLPGETTAPFPALPHPPTPAQAEHLFALASNGDIAAVRAYTAQIVAEDPRLAPFAQQINELTARFKMKAIRSLVARYTPPAPPA